MIRRSLALLCVIALAGCASDQGRYPNLAIRPAERATSAPPPVAPVLTPPPKATLERVAQLSAEAAADHKAFVDQVASARPVMAAAHGTAADDDAWGKAEAALADVRAARSKTMVPLADLDQLYVDASTHGEAVERIAAAREEVERFVTLENRALDELSADLP